MRIYSESSAITEQDRTRYEPRIITGRGNISDTVTILTGDLSIIAKDLAGCVRMESNTKPRVVEFLPGKWRIEFDSL